MYPVYGTRVLARATVEREQFDHNYNTSLLGTVLLAAVVCGCRPGVLRPPSVSRVNWIGGKDCKNNSQFSVTCTDGGILLLANSRHLLFALLKAALHFTVCRL